MANRIAWDVASQKYIDGYGGTTNREGRYP